MDLWFTENQNENVRFSIKIKEHIYSGKSEFQKIDVYETYEFGKLLTIDEIIMVTEKDEFIYHEMITHVPLAAKPDIKNVLVIGGGDGGTVRELTRYKTIEKIDMVEIDKVVVDVSKKYIKQTSDKFNDQRVNLYYEDGIEFVKNKQAEYDLIIVDSTDPIGPGEGLFTEEFYSNCYKDLKEDGIMINQNESPYYEKERKEFKRANKKMQKIFPVVEVYQFHMPTYPSGHWLFGFSSKKIKPVNENIKEWNNLNISTKYYNTDIHKGSFFLPNYVKEIINDEK